MLYRFSKGFRCPMLSEELISLEGTTTGSSSFFCEALTAMSTETSLITYNCCSGKLATTYTQQPSLKSFVQSRRSLVTLPSTPKKRRKNLRVGQRISSYRTETQYRYVTKSQGVPAPSNRSHVALSSWVRSGSEPRKSSSTQNL
jgi:hypothetical protein